MHLTPRTIIMQTYPYEWWHIFNMIECTTVRTHIYVFGFFPENEISMPTVQNILFSYNFYYARPFDSPIQKMFNIMAVNTFIHK